MYHLKKEKWKNAKGGKRMKNRVALPYVRMGQIIELLKTMPAGKVSIKELTSTVSLRRTQIKNIIPSLQTLGLLEYKKGKLELTKNGRELRLNIRSNNEKQCKKIVGTLLGKVEPLSYIVRLLNQEQKLTIEQIGRELAVKYNKAWDHPFTYKTHGAACASIIAFASSAIYDRGVLRKGELVSAPLRIPFPNVTFQKIIRILENIYPRSECSLKELAKIVETSEGRLATEILVCVELKLVTRVSRGLYKISEIGDKLISPLAPTEKSSIFKDCLLKSRYGLIIEKLSDVTFDTAKLGEIIVYVFRAQSTPTTQKVYATKFLNWLKHAQVVKKVERGFYAIDKSRLGEETFAKASKETDQLAGTIEPNEQLARYYEMGKLIGAILANCEKKEVTREDVNKLVMMCRKFEGTEDIVILLNEHGNLFEKLKDPRIFLADIKLLEKILGGKSHEQTRIFYPQEPLERM
jgi:hypothetical protein